MPAIYLTERDVDNLLTVKECVPVVEEAMRHLGTGEAVNQPRRRLRGGGYALQIMSSNVGPMGYVGFKAYGFGPGARTPMKVYLYSTRTGEVLAVLDATNRWMSLDG